MRNQRARRRSGTGRSVTRTTAVLAALSVATGLMVSGTPSEAAPPDPITESNLPWEADLEWQQPGDWKAAGLWEGEGPEQATKCLTEDPLDEAISPTNMYQRDFTFPGGTGKERGSALIMEFDENRDADWVYGWLAEMVAVNCHDTLKLKSFTPVGELEGHRISIPGTEARFTEMSYREELDDDQQEAYFESVGAVRDGNKIALVSMTIWGMDNNWSYESDDSTELPLHPMYRTMPKVADRLTN